MTDQSEMLVTNVVVYIFFSSQMLLYTYYSSERSSALKDIISQSD